MLSKILPWDFIQKYPLTINPKKFGIYSFMIDEAYLERVLLDRLPKKDFNFSLYSGSEFTRDFIEEHFINLSFFSESDHILIMNAETIPASSIEFLLESRIDFGERFLLFFFTKTSKLFSELAKNKTIDVDAIELEMPRFWEGAKIWQFAQKAREVSLNGAVSRFALENLEHNFESFFWLIDTIKMNFPDGNVDLNVLGGLVKKERWDFFELIEIFNRSPKHFFEELLKKEMDYDWMRAMAAFMQTHLVKILFPEEIRSKPKMSKYDQSILECSEKFNRKTVQEYLSFFSELEIMAKSSDVFLIDRLKLESIK
ncbi:MAG: hypothetical protein WC635_04035 [Bacteriovorax sp.]|jgi:hypothetical protein